MLVNLALNSRDAMPSGGVLRIETWNVEGRGGRGPRVRLVVRDTGARMTAEVREHAFEPFFTTKATGEGTGLGLATVYGIVKGAGGDVTIESEPGRRHPGDGRAAGRHRAPCRTRPRTSGSNGGGRVLLVDDEEPVRRIASRILARHGYDVVAPRDAPGGARAACPGSGGQRLRPAA